MGEFFVFLAEMIIFPIFVKEQGKLCAFFHAIIANLVSLVAGGFIITFLPV